MTTGVNAVPGVSTFGNLNTNYGVFNPINTAYDNDIMMPDFLKLSNQGNLASQAQQQSTAPQQPIFTSTQQNAQPQQTFTQEQVEQYLREQGQAQEKEQEPKKSNFFKKLGAAIGLVAPAAVAYFNKTATLKSLAVKCPLFGVIGFVAGSLIDRIFKG